MAAPEPRTQAGTPLWVKVALAVSLCLNLLVLGVVAGQIARAAPDRVIPFNSLGLRYAIRNLPEADRALFSEAASELQTLVGPARAQLTEDRKRLITLITADTFDAAAMRDVLREQSARLADATIVTGDRLIEVLATLSPEARKRFAEALSKPRRRARPRAGTPDNP